MTAPSRTTRRPALAAFRWAAQALRRELVGFRLDYPAEVLDGAAPAAPLHYHQLSGDLPAGAVTTLLSMARSLSSAQTVTRQNAFHATGRSRAVSVGSPRSRN